MLRPHSSHRRRLVPVPDRAQPFSPALLHGRLTENVAGAALGLIVLLAAASSAAASSSLVDTRYWVPNGHVKAVAQVGNTIYLGGEFTGIGPRSGSGLPLSLATGAPAGTLPPVNGRVYTAVADADGGWYIGGQFSAVGYVPRANLAHVLSDGSISAWSTSRPKPWPVFWRSSGGGSPPPSILRRRFSPI